MKKYIFFILILFCLAVFFRFFLLGTVPGSMTDDEIRITYNAYSIWKTGRDVNGIFLPVFFLNYGYAFNPVPIYLVSPIVGIFGLNIFNARFLFAVTGSLSILLIFFIAKKISGNIFIALLSSLVLIFNAWHLQISRIAYEAEIALFFYFLGIILFLLQKKKSYLFLIGSLCSFLLGFYSYSGFKITLLPLFFILLWYQSNNLNKKQIVYACTGILIIYLSFSYFSKTQNASSYGQYPLFFQDWQRTATAVEIDRRNSTAPPSLEYLYNNKYNYWFRIFIDRYQYALSPGYLFVNQEASGVFSLWKRGQFYYHEIFLVILGMYYLYSRKRREFILFLGIILIAPLPSAVGPESVNYTLRSSLMLLPLVIWIGAGIYFLIIALKNQKLRIITSILLAVIYLYLIGGYLTQYYFEWPRYGAVYYAKDIMDVSKFISKESQYSEQVNVAGFNFVNYAFYNGIDPKFIQKFNNGKLIQYKNIYFYPECQVGTLLKKKISYIIPEHCFLKEKYFFSHILPVEEIRDNDGNRQWIIFRLK